MRLAEAAASRSHPRPFRIGRKDGRLRERETGIDAVEQPCQILGAAVAELAATLQDSRRAREAAHGLRPKVPPTHAQQPGPQRTPGRTTGGVA